MTEDTIAAIATGAGGAVSIIRISGGDAQSVALKLWRGDKLPEARRMTLGHGESWSTRSLVDFG